MKGSPRRSKKLMKQLFVIGLAVILFASVIAGIGSFTNSFAPNPAANHESAQLKMHNHVQLSIIINNQQVRIPANIGIDSTLYRNHSLDAYGTANPQVAPLHTHDADGTIHIESTELRSFTLGDFLDIWGLDFAGRTVVLLVDRSNIQTDYRNYVLRDGEQLILNVQ